MTKKDRILANIENSKETQKGIAKLSHFDNEQFYNNSVRYIKAIKEGRMLCIITSVSKSGMSRNLKFLECSKGRDRYNYMNFWALFKALGHQESRSERDSFQINGCGMDMVFHTNYSIIHRLGHLGLLNKKEVASLAQMTPTNH